MQIVNRKLNAITSNASLIYKSYIIKTSIRDVEVYMDSFKFSELCKTGCVNYGKKWSCPPYAPTFIDFTKNYSYITLCLLSMELQQFSYIKNDYLKVKAANSILKSRIDKVLRQLKSDNNHYISTGSCRMCKPCKCKINQPCAHSEIRTYSFEALGINVSNMVQDLFNYELLWYKKGFIPNYTSVVAGLISNKTVDESIILEILKSYT